MLDPPWHTRRLLRQAAFALAFLASLTGLVSIAASHLCLGAALVLLLASRTPLRWPPIVWPLGCFLGWTLVSILASGDPAAGLPQVKKFYVFLLVPVLYSAIREVRDARRLMEAWFAAGALVAVFATGQFVLKWREASAAGTDFLTSYAPDRITGFFSHWMTFSQVALLIAAMLTAYVLFSPAARLGRPLWRLILALLVVGLALSYTRSVWLAGGGIAVYFLWIARPRLMWLAPLGAAVALLIAPQSMQQRLASIADPPPSEPRPIMWRTGLNMIEDRPIFGVGPERVGPLFSQYQPEDVTELPEAYYSHLHSIYIHYAAERGLPALAALLWLLITVLLDWRRALRRTAPGPSDRRFLLHGAIAATLGVMMTGCFDLALGDSEILGAWLAIVVVGYRAAEREGPQAQAAT